MPRAMKYVADALQIVEEECGDASMHSCPHLILSANIHRDIGNLTDALGNYKKCLEILSKSPEYKIEAEVNHEIGTLLSSNDSFHQALTFHAKSLLHTSLRLGFHNELVARGLCAIGWTARNSKLNLDPIAFLRQGKKLCALVLAYLIRQSSVYSWCLHQNEDDGNKSMN